MGRPRIVDVDFERHKLEQTLRALPKVLIGWAVQRSTAQQREAELTWQAGLREVSRQRRRLRRIESKRRKRSERKKESALDRNCMQRVTATLKGTFET